MKHHSFIYYFESVPAGGGGVRSANIWNEPGFNIFVVASGSLELTVNNKKVDVIERGKAFGALALLSGAGRRATARAITNVRL